MHVPDAVNMPHWFSVRRDVFWALDRVGRGAEDGLSSLLTSSSLQVERIGSPDEGNGEGKGGRDGGTNLQDIIKTMLKMIMFFNMFLFLALRAPFPITTPRLPMPKDSVRKDLPPQRPHTMQLMKHGNPIRPIQDATMRSVRVDPLHIRLGEDIEMGREDSAAAARGDEGCFPGVFLLFVIFLRLG